MRTLTRRLEAARVDERMNPVHPSRYDAREIEALPAPVQRYFRAVLQHNQPLIAAVSIELAGTFNLSATAEQWKPFTSRQRIVTRRPGFLWDARIAMSPGLTVNVVDGYIAGEGVLRAALAGLYTVAEQHGGSEIARGELIRFLAEAAWYPTALLPSQGVRWQAVDEHSAHATIVDGESTLTLLFRFGESGLIDSVHADARGAASGAGTGTVMMPWEGRWAGYQAHEGMVVPMVGEAAWLRPDARKPYFNGTVTSLTYEFRC